MTNFDEEHEQIQAVFVHEADELMQQFEQQTVELERDPDNEKILQDLFRIAHTIKGNASILGFVPLVEFAHAVEDVLASLRVGKIKAEACVITLLLRANDILRNLVSEVSLGLRELPANAKQIVECLLEVRETGKVEIIPVAAVTSMQRRSRPWGRRQNDLERWSEEQGQSLRVELGRLDHLLNLTGEMVIARERFRNFLEHQGEGQEALERFRQDDRLFTELQETIHRLRLVPVGPVFRRFVRVVRDLAQEHGCLAQLVLEGEEVEVDTSVIDHVRDPLMHLVRNTISHALESPEERAKKGKSPCGRLTLRAFHEGGWVVLQVEDDGRGFQRDMIRQRASDLLGNSEAKRLSEEELLAMVFEPGFSTADEVTELSGRGVGMDVVKRNVEALRGSISIESVEGVGSLISIRLPLTLAIIEGFVVGVGTERFVLPLDMVTECVDLPQENRVNDELHGVAIVRGKPVPFVRLRRVFGMESVERLRHERMVVVRDGGRSAGFAVDRLVGSSRAVIKPLGTFLRNTPGVSGSTILGDGQVALILDVPNLIRQVRQERMFRE